MTHRSRGRHAGRRGGFLHPTIVVQAYTSPTPDADATAQTATIPGLDLAPGHMRLRPGLPFVDTLLSSTLEPSEVLGEFRVTRRVLVEIGESLEVGRTGLIVAIIPSRRGRPIGVRLDGDEWGPIAWFDEFELQLLPDVDGTELAAAGQAVWA